MDGYRINTKVCDVVNPGVYLPFCLTLIIVSYYPMLSTVSSCYF